MSELMLQMVIKALGLKPEDVRGLIGGLANGQKHIEDIKILLQDNVDINKQILEALKKGKK
jgi:hypothetical protein